MNAAIDLPFHQLGEGFLIDAAIAAKGSHQGCATAAESHNKWSLPQLGINLPEVVEAGLAAEPLPFLNRALGETTARECVVPDLYYVIARLGGNGVRAQSVTLTMGNDLYLERGIALQQSLLEG